MMRFTELDERLRAVAHAPGLLALVRRLVGDDRVVMIQDMALLKPPGGGREKPWHQDNAFFPFEPGTPIIGVWIALDEATPANGCMHVRPGSHLAGPAVHFRRRDWQLCDADVLAAREDEPVSDVTVPLPAGGALFFDGLLHHGTPENRTRTRRRALQLHYVPAAAVRVPEERRLAVFGSGGKNVSC
ncbi:phytanoyl-CoA dioxygenase family protein [Streptomyces sp. NPDC058576]|uniref:phytanoyl-CoA dioxygenase family protein n=1 Tax=Streptomyces sp. NPDC058576 TaxID=3346547 RepID=UPI003661E09A